MKRILKLGSLGFILMMGGYGCSQDLNPTAEYYFNVSNAEVSLKEFYLFTTGEYLYFPNTYYIENHTDKAIEKVTINLKANEISIFNMTMTTPFKEEDLFPDKSFIHQRVIGNHPKLTCEIEYWFEDNSSNKLDMPVILEQHERNVLINE